MTYLNFKATQLEENYKIQSEVESCNATALEVGGQKHGKQSVTSLLSYQTEIFDCHLMNKRVSFLNFFN